MKTIVIGKIVNTHGLKGDLKILSSTDFKDERYANKNTLYVEEEGMKKPLKVVMFREHKGFDLVRFEGYEDINLVSSLLGKDLLAEDRPMRHLKQNEFQGQQLIGLKVRQNQIEKGEVIEIKSYPQGDYLVVSKQDGTALIPFRDEFVLTVDIENHFIDIVNMEGLL